MEPVPVLICLQETIGLTGGFGSPYCEGTPSERNGTAACSGVLAC